MSGRYAEKRTCRLAIRNFELLTADDPQRQRQQWRALVLVVKAKLEAVASGLATVEQEFLANVLLPDGSTVGDWARPQLEEAYETGAMPSVLPGVAPRALGRGDV